MSSEQKITSFEKYVYSFFNHLEIYEDIYNKKEYKKEIFTAVRTFLKSTTVDSAYKVYETFFKAYWIGTQGKENPFLTLIENMKRFEEFAGRLTPDQRDHYIHSVFVFLLGLTVYEQNYNYKKTFKNYALNKEIYPHSYDTSYEEFFYRWGLASLFHDIAYPLEITLKQAKYYADLLCSYPETGDRNLKITMDLCNFEEFIKLSTINPNPRHEEYFVSKYPDYKRKFHHDAIAILSESIANNFNLNFNEVSKNIHNFKITMQEGNFIDHGFYSSVIMLRWYHHLVKSTNWNPAYFYYPIADAASAIFLHNYFEHGLMKSFDLKPLRAKIHPIAYLLVLCDHLQEWKRECYGRENLNYKCPTDFKLTLNNYTLEINYEFSNGCLNGTNFFEINTKIYELLNISDIFESGITIK